MLIFSFPYEWSRVRGWLLPLRDLVHVYLKEITLKRSQPNLLQKYIVPWMVMTKVHHGLIYLQKRYVCAIFLNQNLTRNGALILQVCPLKVKTSYLKFWPGDFDVWQLILTVNLEPHHSMSHGLWMITSKCASERDECPRPQHVCMNKNVNLGHNFLTRSDGAFIMHKCIPCDETFHMVH